MMTMKKTTKRKDLMKALSKELTNQSRDLKKVRQVAKKKKRPMSRKSQKKRIRPSKKS